MTHPITPPLELKQQLYSLPQMKAIETAFQAGADMELEACCEWIDADSTCVSASELRAARRPNPPSLKAEALEQLDSFKGLLEMKGLRSDTIRRALEALPDD